MKNLNVLKKIDVFEKNKEIRKLKKNSRKNENVDKLKMSVNSKKNIFLQIWKIRKSFKNLKQLKTKWILEFVFNFKEKQLDTT